MTILVAAASYRPEWWWRGLALASGLVAVLLGFIAPALGASSMPDAWYAALQKPSLAALRLHLSTALNPLSVGQRLQVDIVKRRSGWPIHGLSIDVQSTTVSRAEVMAQLEFWRSEQTMRLTGADPARGLLSEPQTSLRSSRPPRPPRIAH